MKTTAIIEGLTILEKYRDRKDGANCDAEHDTIYANATDRPVDGKDLARLVELGWFQRGYEESTATHYDPTAFWVCCLSLLD